MIKVFDQRIGQPLTSAVAVIISKTTGKVEQFNLPNGRLERAFSQSDQLDIQINAAGYTSTHRQLAIEGLLTGKIYEFDAVLDKVPIVIHIQAVDSETGKNLPEVQVKLKGPTGTKPVALTANGPGTFTTRLSGSVPYRLTVVAEGYEEVTQRLIASKEQPDVVVRLAPKPLSVETKPVALTAQAVNVATAVSSVSAVKTAAFGVVEKGKSVRLNKIYFDQSSAVLRPESYAELDQLYDVLTQYPSLRIDVLGHTDNQGDFDANVQLSRERCQAVVDYLLKKGIRKNRLKAIGRGPTEPVAPNNNEDNRRKNRRVEFVLL
ncbi:OmpA family protein [Spirosoma soli]|uniref:OmpA family protein n=1 Tax=Spirosoma soli TaxID=1770529 RepID=A0ABW5M471_9BACT